MEYRKVKTTTYKIIQLVTDVFKNDEEFRKIRERFKYKCKACHICNKKFEDNESISLIVTNKGNKVICKTCVDNVAQDTDVQIIHNKEVHNV